jgi:peptidoglycan L-alanyl-D-glutamate endopeptidase CwlK
MNRNVFGTKSQKVKNELHADLAWVLDIAIRRSKVDFGLYYGSRTIADQMQYFQEGKSKINPGRYKNLEDLCEVAKHITIKNHPLYSKSRAVDLLVAEKYKGKKLTWDSIHLSYIAGVIQSVAQELYEMGEIKHVVRWGGDWNQNGVIALDQSLDDLVHFELVKP